MKFPYHDVIISVVADGAGDIWWTFVIIVVILLLLILVMFGVRYKERNTNISYYGEYITYLVIIGSGNKVVSQMRAPLAARCEPTGNQNKATKCAICFWT